MVVILFYELARRLGEVDTAFSPKTLLENNFLNILMDFLTW